MCFRLQTEHKFRDRADYKSDLHLRRVPKGNLIDQSEPVETNRFHKIVPETK